MSFPAARIGLFFVIAQLVLASSANLVPSEGVFSHEQEPDTPRIVYNGEPLVVPLHCDEDHFQWSKKVCSNEMFCELYLKLTGVEEAAGKTFLIGNLHTSSATVSSILLASEDEGVSWYEPYPRLAASFESIQFTDDEFGWIGGQQGQLDGSSRPFLLRTSNGGVRWRRHHVWTDKERSGVILDFYFDTQNHGLLSVYSLTSQTDSYELYESMNSGLSWGIREISHSQTKLKNIPLERRQPNWRLDENSEKGIYSVERWGGRWVSRAEFSVVVGTCHSTTKASPAGP